MSFGPFFIWLQITVHLNNLQHQQRKKGHRRKNNSEMETQQKGLTYVLVDNKQAYWFIIIKKTCRSWLNERVFPCGKVTVAESRTELVWRVCCVSVWLCIYHCCVVDLSSFCLLRFRSRRLHCLDLLMRQGQGSRDGMRPGRGKVHQRVNPIPEERRGRNVKPAAVVGWKVQISHMLRFHSLHILQKLIKLQRRHVWISIK